MAATEIYDCIIAGGGPGGSTAATLLARAGKRVLVLEKERFPRFHLGESLLPYNRRIFEEMGVLRTLEEAGFARKLGAQFHLGNRSKSLKLVFRNGSFTREAEAFQVERARFDQILLRHAEQSGADVREEHALTGFREEADGMVVEARTETGGRAAFRGSYLIDATGRGNATGNLEGTRVVHPKLKKLAVFGHFKGVRLDEGSSGADTVIVRLANKWFWIIPLAADRVSVGLVMDQAEFAGRRQTPREVFEGECRGSSEMRERMAEATALTGIQTTGDFSYYNRRLVGRRLLRVGDAAGFMDPIFSAGVYLAMHSGKLASAAVGTALAAPGKAVEAFGAYEEAVFRAMRYYWRMVEEFYTPTFMELFLEPRHGLRIPDAIVAILAGELEGGWRLAWRRRLFFWLVRVQRWWPLVPRIDFVERKG